VGEGDLDTAMAHVETILKFLDGVEPPNTLLGTQELFLIYLTCYEVLLAAGDSRAQAILDEGYSLLQGRASRLDKTWKNSFLENVPANRALLAAWQRSLYSYPQDFTD